MVAEHDEYTRQRINPQFKDLHYLHLSDLLLCLRPHGTDKPARIMDYGAGVCPYRTLFPNAEYERADISDVAGADYILAEDGTIPAPSGHFDLVISTQVLEHVTNPKIYLSECIRVLRPGGTLLLSTHGLFEDHGCPFDFQRWTADGLHRDLLAEGFDVQQVNKLTCDARAIVYLFERWANTSHTRLGRLFNRLLFPRILRFVHELCDRRFSEFRVVREHTRNQVMYIALLAVARKPECS
jgi:SAM-dependent methyltransferase